MKRAVVAGPKKAALFDAPEPRAIGNWVKVKILAIPMCTEYKAFSHGSPATHLGHEAAGEVVEVDKSARLKVGDRVVAMPLYGCGECQLCLNGDFIHCQNAPPYEQATGSPEGNCTMAQFLLKPDWLLPKIPDGMSYAHASMACCGLGPTFGAMERMHVDAFDTVLITGLGPVGLGGVINGKHRGARVIVAETHPYRVEMARRLGADEVIDPARSDAAAKIRELTNGRGVDKSIDCSGVPAAHRLCIDTTRRMGQVTFVGECFVETPLKISDDMIRKGLTLIGSWHYNIAKVPKLFSVIEKVQPKLEILISHTFPMSKIQEAWELQCSQNCAKVILNPWE
ncbi:MAG TPA: zinc-binding dehydrogenase [Tepidisphaeraceae bacterium]|jgi:threonine dehydrogenase-like Zn-dependent dehydrogenase